MIALNSLIDEKQLYKENCRWIWHAEEEKQKIEDKKKRDCETRIREKIECKHGSGGDLSYHWNRNENRGKEAENTDIQFSSNINKIWRLKENRRSNS